ncbi:hypothetical protein Bresa_00629|uniref:Uncharacterized protein n=1 Tax=Brenneria salicis ATCC 15712 = DSM 30166 TaxID=714314 RepID=A0A366IAA6_9GAMM|nr:hypothetical protein [Brenneria salicis]NMN90553.1 hypothetical protein [Brenneria salicis ATCC 15712 = DSM 30166]RBP64883.1 hypothetical protein DES54_106108 [Brenneria salicis ATCC 15712 = DSM 30166]RLM31599.1 hypothetical protein BHG07_04905 [Brenneria salicis ATCC 15712 = DSM 30166]
MNAKEFNRKYSVGSRFIYLTGPAYLGGKVVRTKDIARDFEKSGAIVEISLAPFFVKLSSLKPAD